MNERALSCIREIAELRAALRFSGYFHSMRRARREKLYALECEFELICRFFKESRP